MPNTSQPIPDMTMTTLTFRDWTYSQSQPRQNCQKLSIRFALNIFENQMHPTNPIKDAEEKSAETEQKDGQNVQENDGERKVKIEKGAL